MTNARNSLVNISLFSMVSMSSIGQICFIYGKLFDQTVVDRHWTSTGYIVVFTIVIYLLHISSSNAADFSSESGASYILLVGTIPLCYS